MCRVIAVSNQKGGVGKTTTSINLGVGLARMGQRVLLVDSDPQGYLTLGLGFPKNIRVTLKNMMENIIMGIEFDPKEAILHHKEGVDVVPSNKLLTGMDMSLITVDDREKVLKEYLEMMADDYDFIIIDCMPSLGMLTINALTAADSVIIPVQAQYLPAKGLEQLLRTITRVKRQLNPKLEVDGIVLTMVDSRTTLAREINALVRKTYGGHVFASEIPRSIKAAEISVENKSIYDHDRSGKAALAYENLTREVLSLGKQIKRHRADPVR